MFDFPTFPVLTVDPLKLGKRTLEITVHCFNLSVLNMRRQNVHADAIFFSALKIDMSNKTLFFLQSFKLHFNSLLKFTLHKTNKFSQP